MSDPLADREGVTLSAQAEASADRALVAAARAGQVRAFEQLLSRHEGNVLRLLRLLGVPPADREDVAQEVFVRVFRHLAGFRSGERFRAWLNRITVNACHDYRRRSARLRGREAGLEAAGEPAAAEGQGPAAGLERGERRLALERALGALSERERAVFVLCEMEGLSSGGVARALGISAITVRRHLGRARRHLRQALTEGEKKRPDR